MNTGNHRAFNSHGHYTLTLCLAGWLLAWLGLGQPLLRAQSFRDSDPPALQESELEAEAAALLDLMEAGSAADGNRAESFGQTTVIVPLAPPEIRPQPQDQTGVQGGRAVFSCGVAGATPQRYQWYYAGVTLTNLAGRITGATNARLILDKLQLEQAGDYWVVAHTSIGAVTSRVARLTVSAPPRIVQQPSSQKVAAGASATFGVVASGTEPLWYQWYYRGSPLAGATNASLSLSDVQPAHAGFYLVKVSNAAGSKISGAAVLQVLRRPQITKDLQDVSVIANGRVVLAATVTGTAPLTFHWYCNGQPLMNRPGWVSGATSARLVLDKVQPGQTGEYWLVAQNGAGSVTSHAAQVTVWAPVRILEQPQDVRAEQGAEVRLAVVATGSEPLSYQWYREDQALPEETNAVLVLTNVRLSEQGNYQVEVRNPVTRAFSRVAKLTIPSPYAGHWRSIREAAGSVNADRAFFDITLADNGTFSGTYQNYAYSYTYYLNTHWGRIPVAVYNPSGLRRSVRGRVDFESSSGTATLTGIGTTSFILTVNDDGSLCFSFPSTFAYTSTVIKR